ncbi:MAG: lipoprotein-releasing ABC transporter permease subunit [Deltaproteobacteria bacterium]|nr:lipoprotein-releasing ABC transporter permease subunit [Candidatus Anaeroferrophillacea bacterium]
MRFELFIACRYLLATRKQVFISLITLISIGGIALGVAALIAVLAVMSGFAGELQQRILGNNAHIMVMQYGGGMVNARQIAARVRQDEAVTAVSPFVLSQVMIAHDRSVSGVVVRGIDPDGDPLATELQRSLTTGALFSAPQPDGTQRPEAVLGAELAKNLGVTVGDTVRIISPTGSPTPLGMVPRMLLLKVGGVFASGMYEYDTSLVYVHLGTAQRLFSMGDRVSGLAVQVEDPFQARQVGRRLQETLGYPYWARDWSEMNRNLFSAMKLERVVMFIILSLIILVAAFNIISTLFMMVMEKHRDIAVLKTLGLSARRVMRIFIWEGMVVGFVGTLLGLAGGLVICWVLRHYQFITLPSDVYYITSLPVKLEPVYVVLTCFASLIISFLATLYPSFRAARMLPAEALRYE